METNFYETDDAAREMRQAMKRKINSSLGLFSNSGSGDRDAVNRLKQNMKLDFNSEGSKKSKFSLLQSPDLNMLKLASPELEKMIIQANGMVTTTPTPTQFIFPKFVTEEQEAYARGFVDALAELHDPNQTENIPVALQSKGVVSSQSLPQTSKGGVTLFAPNSNTVSSFNSAPVTSQGLTTTTSLPGGLTVSSASRSLKSVSNNDILLPRLKEEPQTVPCIENTPPLSPINMENQEVIKLERKRARNRVAARKCRTRKLERISRLEDRVKDLKGQNADLVTTATTLRDQVCKLKRQIIDHVNSGCQIMMTQNISF
ncbi:transcription factor Jun-like [Haliotis asinina]|uniref:transcription factor Jun-like n=1 Tax=Haliotis asinina TaxID=109174 RepID=UPI0035322CAA